MKYSGIQKVMWKLFQKSFRKNLVVLGITDRKLQRTVAKNAFTKYQVILDGIPEFGENDVLEVNILSAAIFAAFYLSLPSGFQLIRKPGATAFPETEECEDYVEGAYTIKEFADYYEQAMNQTLAMKVSSKKDLFSAAYQNKKRADAEKSQNATNPYSWKYTFSSSEDGTKFDTHFTQCGIWQLMQELGIPELTPAMCRYDYSMAEAMNANFSREHTLAGGGDVCDCHYAKKQ